MSRFLWFLTAFLIVEVLVVEFMDYLTWHVLQIAIAWTVVLSPILVTLAILLITRFRLGVRSMMMIMVAVAVCSSMTLVPCWRSYQLRSASFRMLNAGGNIQVDGKFHSFNVQLQEEMMWHTMPWVDQSIPHWVQPLLPFNLLAAPLDESVVAVGVSSDEVSLALKSVYFPNARVLNVECDLSLEGWEAVERWLAHHPHVRVLDLPSGVEPPVSLLKNRGIERVFIHGLVSPDKTWLASLADLPDLKVLSLDCFMDLMNDEETSQALKQCQQLEQLGVQTPLEQFGALREALPNCKVELLSRGCVCF